MSTNLKPNAAGEDHSSYACQDAIHALHYAAPSLPNLNDLSLADSPIHADDIDVFVTMLAAVSSSLKYLGLDAWAGVPTPGFDGAFQTKLFRAISRMKKLRVLSVRDWDKLTQKVCARVVEHAVPTEPLRRLPNLTQIRVAGLPCETCESIIQCPNHLRGLPFSQFGAFTFVACKEPDGIAEADVAPAVVPAGHTW